MESTSLIEAASRRLSSGAGAAARVYERAFASGSLDLGGLGLSARSISAWEDNFTVGLLPVLGIQAEPGPVDEAASKAVLGLADGLEIECVRIPMPGGSGGKATICVSSQAGCRMGCAFCETGRGGLARSLRASEIVAQVLTARVGLGWDCGNIVFMGMGECLDNLGEVSAALRVLADPRGLSFSMERITLCTSGPPGGVEALRSLSLKRINLSFSLNAGNDRKRGELMPIARTSRLEDVAASLAAYSMRRNFVLGVNWCLLPGINDSREDAREAAAFCSRVGRSLLNLIPYNPGRLALTRAPSEEEISRFASWLEEDGCLLRRRPGRGGKIMAGCGQLGSGSIPREGRAGAAVN